MRIAAPSFIKKADRITNVIYLKEFVCEVELLYMSSSYDGDEPDSVEVNLLAETDMLFNVHLPYDLDLSIENKWSTIELFINKLKALKAYTHTIHIQKEESFFVNLKNFIDKTGAMITVENAENDADLLGKIKGTGAGICADLGHVMHYKGSVEKVLNDFSDEIKLIHLHASYNNKDHQSLKYADPNTLTLIKKFAEEKDIAVCIEVFDKDGFFESLKIFSEL